MSWLDKVNTDLIIKTGDGLEYRPKWFSATKQLDFNFAEFDFLNLKGTYVDRKEQRGRKFPIDIVFDGDDHLTISEQFEFSCNNKNAWEITHPYYGTIICQPTSLVFNNDVYNVSRITGILYETILLNNVEMQSVYPIQKINNIYRDTEIIATEKVLLLEKLNVTERKTLLRSIEDTYNVASSYIVNNDASALYKRKFDQLASSISSVTYDMAEIAKGLHEFSVLPYTFIDDVNQRLRAIQEQLEMTFDNIGTLFSRRSKRMYEQDAGFKIIALALSALDNVGDFYENSSIISDVIDMVYDLWMRYMETLEELSTDYEGTPDSFIPDYDLSNSLAQIVGLVILSLMDMLTSAKKERVFYLSDDESLLTIVKKIYGLDASDENIVKFIKQNNIGLGEILLLKKGRKIVYYI